ncbi:uncharacterized protein N7469_006419 [Penicillium citrinum]|uniref:Uncharacterized protein n=1 Tax=Penicillium citrinum TaxID=5077 RepID=A0A9W9TMD1_PENCI|nr:uncharacterized protein N7469_006419 [Penicillium citrinum]KAJ5231831.1 hypothetical protein N7469_006419 [Penicillium citrinum]
MIDIEHGENLHQPCRNRDIRTASDGSKPFLFNLYPFLGNAGHDCAVPNPFLDSRVAEYVDSAPSKEWIAAMRGDVEDT